MPQNPEAKLETDVVINDPTILESQQTTRQKCMDIVARTGERIGTAVGVGAELLGIGTGVVIKTTGKATVLAVKGIFQGLKGAGIKNVSLGA